MKQHFFDRHLDRIRNARAYGVASDEEIAASFADVNDDLDERRAWMLIRAARVLDGEGKFTPIMRGEP